MLPSVFFFVLAAVIEPLLTAGEVAEMLRVKKSWLYDRIQSGELPFAYTKVGPFVRFKRSEVEAYIAAQTTTPKSTTLLRVK